ncbi:PAS domain S-box protein [Flavobacterium sp. JLP]|uniref:PAS domain-containing sensor histidine kinase n=1 Tax=unclassified Flavobacterium TaxID=196869 RepID=UPI00188D0409|nr:MULTISPECIES: ATP-binding protein [unclassified Flavobacterium]MBF4494236.1 PAS domain S-box protein [Flavobacterium sp. MR2016-29]MBF4507662.1 PAS domain S-box protein [Flavobacterium sp. JLP]
MYRNMGLLNDIVDNTPLPIAVYSGNNLKIELANTSMIKTWGKGDQVLGKNYLDVLPELKKEDFFEQATTVMKSGIPFHGNNKRVDLIIEGVMTTHYFNYSFIPLKNADGTVYGVMNTGTDVTELHLAQQQIKNSEERLRMAIDASGLGTYEIDLVTKKIKTSGNFNSIWSVEGEISNEEIIAKLHPDDLPVREKAHEEAVKTGKICYETRIIDNDDTIKWAKIKGEIIKDENNIPTTIIGVVQDINEQRKFEDELKKQVASNTEELRRSNDDLLHFANVVSHDLREPVRKIKIFNTLLRNEKDIDFNDNCIKYLNKIDQSTQRMQNLIEGILSYSTLSKNTQPNELINLNEIIENIKIDLELIIKEKGAIFVGCDLPEIEGVPILISQLFYNLMQNALKFSKAEEPPRVIITCSSTTIDGAEAVQISIKDNGIGMDAAFAEKIFNAFERLHSKDEYEGNGLGLSLCRKIAKRHNGTITATGEKDNGAEFIVTLPLKQDKLLNEVII